MKPIIDCKSQWQFQLRQKNRPYHTPKMFADAVQPDLRPRYIFEAFISAPQKRPTAIARTVRILRSSSGRSSNGLNGSRSASSTASSCSGSRQEPSPTRVTSESASESSSRSSRVKRGLQIAQLFPHEERKSRTHSSGSEVPWRIVRKGIIALRQSTASRTGLVTCLAVLNVDVAPCDYEARVLEFWYPVR